MPDPFSPILGSRLYRSGDLVRYLADGNIEFLGRIDLQVKIRGFRIELGEIETILNQHESVRDVVVIVAKDTSGDKKLAAYLIAEDKTSIDIESLNHKRRWNHVIRHGRLKFQWA